MLAAAFHALRDMFSPPLRRVLLKSIGLALLLVVLIGIALQRLFSWLATSGAAWAQAGTAAMIGIFRTSIRGSSVAGVTSATVVQSLFFTGVSVVMVILALIFRPRTVSKGSPSVSRSGTASSRRLSASPGRTWATPR